MKKKYEKIYDQMTHDGGHTSPNRISYKLKMSNREARDTLRQMQKCGIVREKNYRFYLTERYWQWQDKS